MNDDDDVVSNVGRSGSGSGGGGGWEGAGGLSLASQYSSTQGGGGGGGGGGAGGGSGGSRAGGAGGDGRAFGEGKEPDGALKGSMMWCARLSLAIRPDPATARRLSQVFGKVRKGKTYVKYCLLERCHSALTLFVFNRRFCSPTQPIEDFSPSIDSMIPPPP